MLDDLKLFVNEAPHDNDLDFEDDDEDDDENGEEEVLVLNEDELALMDAYDMLPIALGGLEPESTHAQHGFPRIATTRNNLTALSQRYNVRHLALAATRDGCADRSF